MALLQLYTCGLVPAQGANENTPLSSSPVWLYAIAPSSQGPVKIGISQYPWARLKDLQIGSPVPLFLYYRIPLPNRPEALIAESQIHQLLTDEYLWSHGEWFKITVPHAIQLINYISAEDPEGKLRYAEITP